MQRRDPTSGPDRADGARSRGRGRAVAPLRRGWPGSATVPAIVSVSLCGIRPIIFSFTMRWPGSARRSCRSIRAGPRPRSRPWRRVRLPMHGVQASGVRDGPMRGVTVNPGWRDGAATKPRRGPVKTAPDAVAFVRHHRAADGSLVSHASSTNDWSASGWVSASTAGPFSARHAALFRRGALVRDQLLAAGGTVISPAAHDTGRADRGGTRAPDPAMFLVPTQVRGLLEEWRGDGSGCPAFGCWSPAARRCPGRAASDHRTPDARFLDYYATSEGGGIAVLPRRISFASRTVGRPAFRVERDRGRRGPSLPDGEVGRLRYRGPGVARTMSMPMAETSPVLSAGISRATSRAFASGPRTRRA